MHGTVPENPARGKAQGRIGSRPDWLRLIATRREYGPQTGAKPRSRCHIIPGRPLFRSLQLAAGHPDENQSGRTSGTNDMWARIGSNAVRIDELRQSGRDHRAAAELARCIHPARGSKPAKGRTPGAPPGETREGHSPGQAAELESPGSGTPRQGTRRRMTRLERQIRAAALEVAGSFASVRSGFTDPTCTDDRRRTGCEQQAV